GSILVFLDVMLAPKMPLIALAVALVYLLYKVNKDRKKLWLKYFILFVLYLVIPFTVPSIKNRLLDAKSVFTSASGKMDERLIILSCGKDIFVDNVWLGVGSRNDQKMLDSCYASKDFKQAKDIIYNAHNQFITLGINYGIPEVLFFIFLIGYFIIKVKENTLVIAFIIFTI